VNIVEHEDEARSVFENLSNAVVRFLKGISLEYVGYIPKDSKLAKAVRQQSTVTTRYPESTSSQGFSELARRLMAASSETAPDGNIRFFWKKLVTG
jgi:flagellar biosynthesis protein FlhG